MDKYSPISLDYFLNMELSPGGGGKEIIKQNNTLKTVRDVVNFYSIPSNLEFANKQITPQNAQYFNCMIAEFRHNTGDHHKIGWENMTMDYYNSLSPMSDNEIEIFLQNNPVEFDNGFIRHSYHRACAMIGRLIKGKPYIPFYMKTTQIYDEARKKDGLHRIKPLTNKIKLLSVLDNMGIDRNEYCICQSGILNVMGIRDNDDLDLIISSKLRNQNINFPPGIDVFSKDRKKFDYFGASGDDDILQNYCTIIGGYKFLEPRFYFARKFINKSSRDISDWEGIDSFFKQGKHKGYPFNFEFYKWGLPYMTERIDISELDLNSLKLIKDKYNRIVDGVNHGRAVYQGDGYYIKIFHPEYCRLSNFIEALKSGFLNGLTPSLTHLITDKNQIIGYITLSGDHPSQIPDHLTRSILRNCKQRNKLFYDLVPINVIKDHYYGEWGLIDLESVYDLDKLNLLHTHNAEIKPPQLLEWIKRI